MLHGWRWRTVYTAVLGSVGDKRYSGVRVRGTEDWIPLESYGETECHAYKRHEVWDGSHHFFAGGRVMVGIDSGMLMLTNVMLGIFLSLFAVEDMQHFTATAMKAL